MLPTRDEIEPIEAGDSISADAASAVNEALADYGRTGNPLFLYEAADLCSANDIEFPKPVQKFINGIVSGIHRLSEKGGRREDIADVVVSYPERSNRNKLVSA